MQASVDRETCSGCGLCPEICPSVFDMDEEDIAIVKVDPVPAAEEEKAREAAESCPVEAITIKE